MIEERLGRGAGRMLIAGNESRDCKLSISKIQKGFRLGVAAVIGSR